MENNFQIDSAAVSDRGLSEKRPQNEDSFLELSNRGIFAVADGVGGAQAGDVASQMAMEILGEAFANLQNGSDPEDMMKLAIERANAAIFQMSQDLAQFSTMATTIVALHISGNIATIGHVGDSRLYRLDQKGELYRETQDHSVVEEEVRAGRMTREQAANHPSRNVISRALGAEPTVEIDMKTIMFEPETTFLLCSDGITRHIHDSEIKELLNSGAASEQICGQMKEICYQRGAEDNLTAVIVRVKQAFAENIASAPRPADADFEEATVATARSASGGSNYAVVATQPEIISADNPEDDDFATRQFSRANQISIPANADYREPAAESFDDRIKGDGSADLEQKSTERGIISYQEEKSSGGVLAKLFGGLVLLLIGGVLGAGAYYFYMPKPEAVVPPPVSEKPVAENIEYKSFEDLRRRVDENPQQYLFTTNEKADSAEEYYLLGRSYLLTGKYAEAKQALTEAKNRLATADQSNSKILATEIAMGLAVANAPASAQQSFQKDLPSSSGNINANSAVNP